MHLMPLDAACAERCFLYRSIWYMTVEIINRWIRCADNVGNYSGSDTYTTIEELTNRLRTY